MMGRQTADQARLFYEFHLDERVPADHLLRRIDVFAAAALGRADGKPTLPSPRQCTLRKTAQFSGPPRRRLNPRQCRT